MESKKVGSLARDNSGQLCIQHPDSKNGIRRDYRSDRLLGFSRVEVSYPDEATTFIVRQPRPGPVLPGPIAPVEVRESSESTIIQKFWQYINKLHPLKCDVLDLVKFGSLGLGAYLSFAINREESLADHFSPLVLGFIGYGVLDLLKLIRREQLEARRAAIRDYIRDSFHTQAIERLDRIIDSLIGDYNTLALQLNEQRFERQRGAIGFIINDLSVEKVDKETCTNALRLIRDLIEDKAVIESIKQAAKLFTTLIEYYKRSEKPFPVLEALNNTAQLIINLVGKLEHNKHFYKALKIAVELANILVEQNGSSQFSLLVLPALTDAVVNLLVELDRLKDPILQQATFKLLKDINPKHFEELFPKEAKNKSTEKPASDFFKMKKAKASSENELQRPLLLKDETSEGRESDGDKKHEYCITING